MRSSYKNQKNLLGAALRSCHKVRHTKRLIQSDLEDYLPLAKYYKSCVQVLSPVADYFDFVYMPLIANEDSFKACPDLQAINAQEFLTHFLRIYATQTNTTCHYSL